MGELTVGKTLVRVGQSSTSSVNVLSHQWITLWIARRVRHFLDTERDMEQNSERKIYLFFTRQIGWNIVVLHPSKCFLLWTCSQVFWDICSCPTSTPDAWLMAFSCPFSTTSGVVCTLQSPETWHHADVWHWLGAQNISRNDNGKKGTKEIPVRQCRGAGTIGWQCSVWNCSLRLKKVFIHQSSGRSKRGAALNQCRWDGKGWFEITHLASCTFTLLKAQEWN